MATTRIGFRGQGATSLTVLSEVELSPFRRSGRTFNADLDRFIVSPGRVRADIDVRLAFHP